MAKTHWTVSADYLREQVVSSCSEPVSRSQAGLIRNAIADALYTDQEVLSFLIAIHASSGDEKERLRQEFRFIGK